jgi:1-acyl-sn-glycerol-3-phosphate acyltransferase
MAARTTRAAAAHAAHAASPAAADPSSALPYLDESSPPLSGALPQLAVLLLAPLALARLAALFAGVAAYVLLLLCLQRRARPADPDAPAFRCYPLARAASFRVARFALACCGFHVRVHGAEHVAAAYAAPRVAPVVVCNHVSYLDIFSVGAAIGPYHPVSRADAATWPLFGRALRAWGFTGVDRSAAAGAGVTAQLAARAARTRSWAEHPPVLAFPEGTCTTNDVLMRFKSGAFVAGTPVLPLVLRYSAGALNASWVWRDQRPTWRPLRALSSDALHLLRLLLACGKTLDVYALPPYTPSAAERADPALFAENVRSAMGAALGVPLDARGLEDARAYYTARIAGYSKSC